MQIVIVVVLLVPGSQLETEDRNMGLWCQSDGVTSLPGQTQLWYHCVTSIGGSSIHWERCSFTTVKECCANNMMSLPGMPRITEYFVTFSTGSPDTHPSMLRSMIDIFMIWNLEFAKFVFSTTRNSKTGLINWGSDSHLLGKAPICPGFYIQSIGKLVIIANLSKPRGLLACFLGKEGSMWTWQQIALLFWSTKPDYFLQ